MNFMRCVLSDSSALACILTFSTAKYINELKHKHVSSFALHINKLI